MRLCEFQLMYFYSCEYLNSFLSLFIEECRVLGKGFELHQVDEGGAVRQRKIPNWACAFERGLCSTEACKERGRSME